MTACNLQSTMAKAAKGKNSEICVRFQENPIPFMHRHTKEQKISTGI